MKGCCRRRDAAAWGLTVHDACTLCLVGSPQLTPVAALPQNNLLISSAGSKHHQAVMCQGGLGSELALEHRLQFWALSSQNTTLHSDYGLYWQCLAFLNLYKEKKISHSFFCLISSYTPICTYIMLNQHLWNELIAWKSKNKYMYWPKWLFTLFHNRYNKTLKVGILMEIAGVETEA